MIGLLRDMVDDLKHIKLCVDSACWIVRVGYNSVCNAMQYHGHQITR